MRQILRRRSFLAAAPLAAALPTQAQKLVQFRTQAGPVILQLELGRAPLSARDFLRYVEAGLYHPGRFFRAVRPENDHGHPSITVLQGGISDPSRAWAPVPHEPTSQTGLRHQDGTISLTRDKPGTGSGAEFFICLGDQPALDAGGHRNPDGLGFAAFGRVIQGMEAVRSIWALPTSGKADDAYTQGQILTTDSLFEALRL